MEYRNLTDVYRTGSLIKVWCSSTSSIQVVEPEAEISTSRPNASMPFKLVNLPSSKLSVVPRVSSLNLRIRSVSILTAGTRFRLSMRRQTMMLVQTSEKGALMGLISSCALCLSVSSEANRKCSHWKGLWMIYVS